MLWADMNDDDAKDAVDDDESVSVVVVVVF